MIDIFTFVDIFIGRSELLEVIDKISSALGEFERNVGYGPSGLVG